MSDAVEVTEAREAEQTTGDISKNALKKQLKAEEAAKKKAAKEAEKAAKKAAEPPSSGSKAIADDSEELDPTQYYENRLKAITALEVLSDSSFAA